MFLRSAFIILYSLIDKLSDKQLLTEHNGKYVKEVILIGLTKLLLSIKCMVSTGQDISMLRDAMDHLETTLSLMSHWYPPLTQGQVQPLRLLGSPPH